MRTRRSAWCCIAVAASVVVVCWASTGSALAACGGDDAPLLLAPAAERSAPATHEGARIDVAITVSPAPQLAAPVRAVSHDVELWVRGVATERLLAIAPKTSPPAR